MKIMCIWTRRAEENLMKIAISKKDLEGSKADGRKPDKLITRATEIDKMKIRDLRKYVAHDGQIVVDGKVVYDGKQGIR